MFRIGVIFYRKTVRIYTKTKKYLKGLKTMSKKLRKPLSIILSLMMILSVFTIVPITAAAKPVYSSYIITFAGNGKTKNVEVESLPRTFMADWWNENG
jgi:hypothetical protein